MQFNIFTALSVVFLYSSLEMSTFHSVRMWSPFSSGSSGFSLLSKCWPRELSYYIECLFCPILSLTLLAEGPFWFILAVRAALLDLHVSVYWCSMQHIFHDLSLRDGDLPFSFWGNVDISQEVDNHGIIFASCSFSSLSSLLGIWHNLFFLFSFFFVLYFSCSCASLLLPSIVFGVAWLCVYCCIFCQIILLVSI